MTARRFSAPLFILLVLAVAPARPEAPASSLPVIKKLPVPPDVKVLRDVPYVANGHPRQKLDLYLPEKASAPLPVIVCLHGGGWSKGDKSETSLYLAFVPSGYAAAAVNYRLSGQAKFPAQIEDCKAAIRWLRANAKKYGLDADHIVAWGGSAGGHLAALVGTSGGLQDFDVGENLDQSSRVQAVCDWFGPTDLSVAVSTPGYENQEVLIPAVHGLLGGSPAENKTLAAAANPINSITPEDPPFLIIHGDADPIVPLNQSELLQAALQRAGVSSTIEIVKGGGHDGPPFRTPEMLAKMGAFFDRYLKVPGPR